MGSLRRPSRGSALPGSPPKLTGFPGCLLSALPAGLSWGQTSLLSETGCVISFFSFERPPTLVISSSSSCRRKLLINVLKELVPGFVTWMRRLLSSSSANTTPPYSSAATVRKGLARSPGGCLLGSVSRWKSCPFSLSCFILGKCPSHPFS